MAKLSEIRIFFSAMVEVPDELLDSLHQVVSELCGNYEKDNPGRVMWPATVGYQMINDEPLEFDDSVFTIECFEREECSNCVNGA